MAEEKTKAQVVNLNGCMALCDQSGHFVIVKPPSHPDRKMEQHEYVLVFDNADKLAGAARQLMKGRSYTAYYITNEIEFVDRLEKKGLHIALNSHLVNGCLEWQEIQLGHASDN